MRRSAGWQWRRQWRWVTVAGAAGLLVAGLHSSAYAQSAVRQLALANPTISPTTASPTLASQLGPLAVPQPAALATEAFATLPAAQALALSPDGQRLAGLRTVNGETQLYTRVLGGEAEPLVLLRTDNRRVQFNWLRWVNNERLVVSVRHGGERDGVPSVETRLLAVQYDGSQLVHLVRPEPAADAAGDPAGAQAIPQVTDQVVDWLPEDGRHILLALAEPGPSVYPGVRRVDVYTGAHERVLAPQKGVLRWWSDAQHRVRLAWQQRGARVTILARGSDGSPDGGAWRPVAQEGWVPLGFGADPNIAYFLIEHAGFDAVFEARLDQLPTLVEGAALRPPSEVPGLRLLLAAEGADLQGQLLRDAASGQPIGIGPGAGQTAVGAPPRFWAGPYTALARRIDRALPQRYNRLLQFSQDGQRYLVYSSGNGAPGEFYLGDRRTDDLELLAEQYPGLDPERLAGKQAIQIEARDGLRLPGFLTLPRQGGRVPAPLVVLPHGGPIGQDSDDFDAWSEFLAARGYAVLQVNFRGSAGQGGDFELAGRQRWGLAMQDDLADATAWAVDQGVADPARICIVGGSYGGYAALMGLVKTPGLDRCAVSLAGVADLPQLWRHEASSFLHGRAWAREWLGDLDQAEDRARLQATSPALQAARIEAPVLLVHGTEDRSVPYAQSQAMAEALQRAHKPYRLVTLEGGDHQLSRAADRLVFFHELERFLALHLGPSMAPTLGAVLPRY